MPEHVHLLVYALTRDARIDELLRAIKRPFSYRIKQLLKTSQSPLLNQLTIRQRPGVTAFRFWQEGPGYDRNLTNEKSVLAAIDYLHRNPVRRGLSARAVDWYWSSARWYADEGQRQNAEMPKITSLPASFFVDAVDYTPD
jgi:putative transposase